VVVIDRCGGPGQGNSAKSEGGFRNVFASEANYLLADSTIDWFTHLENDLGYDLKLAHIGYLWLFSEAQHARLEDAFETMRDRGVELKTFGKEDLERMIPDLVTDFEGDEEADLLGLEPVDVGVLGVKCGSIDADALVRSYEAEFLKLGGEVRYSTEATRLILKPDGEVRYSTEATRLILKPEEELEIPGEPFVWQDIRVAGAETSRGEILAGTTVVAAGVWSARLLDPIGFDALMRPKKRVIFVFKHPNLRKLRDARGFSEHNILPFTHIPEISVYMKADPAEGSIWLGCADDFGRGYGLEDDPQPEAELYSNNIYHALVRFLPCFENVRPVNMWAGQRAINRYDRIPVVAPAPGMIYVGSATGYGITKCDALGRTVAALYADEEEVELFGGRRLKAADLGIETRNVGKEVFKV